MLPIQETPRTNLSVRYNGGVFPDIILINIDPMLVPLRNRLNPSKEFVSLQAMFPPERFDSFLTQLGGCSIILILIQGLDASRIFFKLQQLKRLSGVCRDNSLRMDLKS